MFQKFPKLSFQSHYREDASRVGYVMAQNLFRFLAKSVTLGPMLCLRLVVRSAPRPESRDPQWQCHLA
ncbi:unnamed protein product [Cuscuta campestris]|uniref:Uncharacterized protein n=1 Tax=Cuscuta campestris TaxID=132261 RepID=A0A484L6U4_9ASTE|nr:unnamed protein product [Cuscuta campestris]